MASTDASAALECFFAMLGKTDGRDKMLATLQYCAMFVGGMDKNATTTTIFKALGGARKPFRFVKVRRRDGTGAGMRGRARARARARGARGARTHPIRNANTAG